MLDGLSFTLRHDTRRYVMSQYRTRLTLKISLLHGIINICSHLQNAKDDKILLKQGEINFVALIHVKYLLFTQITMLLLAQQQTHTVALHQ